MSKVTIYITKYALTKGIVKAEAELLSDNMAKWIKKGNPYSSYLHGDDFHTSLSEAIKKASDMAVRKRKSLEKQIEKISKIDITKIVDETE